MRLGLRLVKAIITVCIRINLSTPTRELEPRLRGGGGVYTHSFTLMLFSYKSKFLSQPVVSDNVIVRLSNGVCFSMPGSHKKITPRISLRRNVFCYS